MDLETLKTKIEQGDIDGVKDFIKNHPDSINKKDGFSGWTALMLAIRKGNTDILKLLLNNDADVNTRNKGNGWTALHLAVLGNHREAVEELLKKTTIQVNLQTSSGQTPLHWACFNGYKDIVGSLLSHNNISTNVVNRQGDTPLDVAVQSQNYDVVTLMLSQNSVNFEMKNNENRTPLLEAVSRGHLGILQKVIARGANVNVVDNEGNNCLHLALTRCAFDSEVEHMDILDKCCEDLKLRKKERLSQVVVACYLAHHGANFYCKNKSGKTPLDLIEKGNVKETLMTLFPQCRYCQEKMATVTLQPCGHVVLCENCCSEMTFKKCPMCRQYTLSKTGFENRTFEDKEIQTLAEPIVCPNCEYKASHTEPVKKRTFEDKEIQTLAEPIGTLKFNGEYLHRAAKKLGSNWQQVATCLGVPAIDQDIIKNDFPRDTVKQSYQMLCEWFINCKPEERTVETLRKAFKEAECFAALECLSLKER